MQNFNRFFRIITIIFSAIFFHSAAHAESVNVFAAASLKTALDDVGRAWKTQSGKDIVATYGSTATLAKQISETAPADIFISADLAWMDDVARKFYKTKVPEKFSWQHSCAGCHGRNGFES